MKASEQIVVESNQHQAESKYLSKRESKPGSNPADIMYARFRRLEQRIEQLESGLSTVRRDAYRIEKRQQREQPSKIPTDQAHPTFGFGIEE